MDKSNHKKLLILTTYFTPAAEIAAARLKSIIKYLLRLGWEIYVISDLDQTYDYSSDEILGKINLYTVASPARGSVPDRPDSAQVLSLRSAIKRLRLSPALIKAAKSAIHLFRYKRWITKASSIGLAAIEKNQIKIVLATVPGVEALSVGSRIKQKNPSVRLICEYRDIISGNIIYKSIQSRFEYFIMERMEKAAFPSVDSFLYLTEGIKNHYIQLSNQNAAASNGLVLTNGYDGELCPNQEHKKSNRLVMNHIGHFYGSRSAVVFTEAFAELSQEKPEIAERFSIHFIGKMDTRERLKIQKICRENNLSNIQLSAPVSHEEALRIMASSDVNLIITHQSGSEYALPGKIFEYIGAGRPILAITSDSLLTAFMADEKLGWMCTNQPCEIKSCLENIYAAWLKDCLKSRVDRNLVYEMGHIADRLDRFLTQG